MKRIVSTLTLASVLLTPLSALGATAAAAELTAEDLLQVIESEPALPVMSDGKGGGGAGLIYPGPGYGGGVQVDASITKEVTPDFIAINAYCEVQKSDREQGRAALNQLYLDIKKAVGTDGRVRKSGQISIYPAYGPMGLETGNFSANLGIFIKILRTDAVQRISDLVEDKGCGVNWDVRLVDTQGFEMDVLDSLITRLNKRKTIFEKLLGRRLTLVTSASLYTWVDSYGTYDPDTNRVDATTTLSVSFDLGGRTKLPSPMPLRSTTPKG